MADNKYINFLKEDEILKKKSKKRGTAKFFITIAVVFITVVSVYSLNVLLIKSSSNFDAGIGSENSSFISNLFTSIKKIKILGQLSDLIEVNRKELRGEDADRVNILLVGFGGEQHEGGLLADTVILSSLKPSTLQAGMLSIPRDLSVPIKGYGINKINTAHAFGEMREEGRGIELLKDTVENITGQEINYYVKINFDGFKDLVDDLGGVCLDVENDLIDYQYPIRGRENSYPISARYEYLKIKKGWNCMDGSLALKYARSRHAIGIEGTDFSRAKRQQNLLEAIKDKAISLKTILNPQKVIKILKNLKKNLKTDFKVADILRVAKFAKEIDTSKIGKKVLDNNPAGPLIDGYIELENGVNAYVLETKSGDFEQIQNIAKNIFKEVKSEEAGESVKKERAAIEILNGTTIPGWAYQTSLELKEMGLEVSKIGNSVNQNFKRTIIYCLKPDEYKNTIALLKKSLNALTADELPGWMDEPSTGDILIILGKDE